jgi:hypothetical protein
MQYEYHNIYISPHIYPFFFNLPSLPHLLEMFQAPDRYAVALGENQVSLRLVADVATVCEHL